MGHFLAKILPTQTFTVFGQSFSLNPGPFSIKEHILIGTMTAVNTNSAYAVDIVVLLLVFTTQVTGFALAGALRKFLIRPAHMIWPSTLVTASLFRSLHHSSIVDSGEDMGRMPRMRYFLLVTLGMFFFYWLPGLIFPTLGVLSWICWIKPDNIVLSQLTGSNGLGIGTISLDWAAVSQYVSPLVSPWFAQVNIIIGFVLVVYAMSPWAYYTNLWDAKTYPILTADLYTENGDLYNKSEVLTDNVLDRAKYIAYVNTQALAFTADLKLGHYMKIPPRTMFMAQVVSTILCGAINLATATWLIETRPNICTKQGYPFTCRSTNTFYSASIIWGAIGPARVFESLDRGLYGPVSWGFLVGALLPIPFWLASKRWPHMKWLHLAHWPVLLAATSNIPPALPYMYTNGFMIGFIFMWFLKRCRYNWWA
ncbi:hypothetical protein EMPS_02423 [Entomortierella parvispora]|uniref:Uncharacterized protein n=1 Tax=Entomortierella parvispora TaxID=205924 RepID=A0A9P3LTM2_9FUNG|nr:hypothetical protein EMPS_02423 [Entomortierella parvispora]